MLFLYSWRLFTCPIRVTVLTWTPIVARSAQTDMSVCQLTPSYVHLTPNALLDTRLLRSRMTQQPARVRQLRFYTLQESFSEQY